jgi:hypothetical protein
MPTLARRTLAAALTGLAALAALVAPPSAASAETAASTTTVTLTVRDCDGCRVQVSSVMRADWEDVWTSRVRRVVDEQVTFRVPTERTAGLSIAIDTPWARALPYQTMVALRYRGYAPGDRVRFADIRSSRRASGCWAGTTAETAEMTIKVRRVKVMGHFGPTPGALAFAKVTQDYLFPMQRVYDGVLGTQDVFACGPE